MIRLIAAVIGLVSACFLAATPNGPVTVALIWVFAACFYVTARPAREPRPVSPHFERKTSE